VQMVADVSWLGRGVAELDVGRDVGAEGSVIKDTGWLVEEVVAGAVVDAVVAAVTVDVVVIVGFEGCC